MYILMNIISDELLFELMAQFKQFEYLSIQECTFRYNKNVQRSISQTNCTFRYFHPILIQFKQFIKSDRQIRKHDDFQFFLILVRYRFMQIWFYTSVPIIIK